MKIAFLAALLLGIGSAAGAQEAPPAREASAPLTLRKCLEIGLEQNYDVRIVRNEERVSDNNATAGNAGMLPTVDLSAGYTGTLDNDRTVTPRNGDATTETGVYDQTANVGLAVNWTLFDGLRIRTNYKRLKEMQQMGALKTRITIEDFMASLTAEYYNYIQQTLRLENFRYAVSLSRERLRITEARVYAADQLFATLDPTLRRIDVADVGETVLADTVGFIRHLPHDLVAAFKATLQETRQATLLLHVIDAADVRVQENIEAVNTVLEEIDAHEIPTLLVMNKIDMLEDFEPRIDRDEENKPIRVWLSAQTGAGIPQLFQALTERLSGEVAQHTLRLPPQEGRLRSRFYQLQAIEKEWMEEDGSVSLQVRMPIVDWRRLCKQEPALIDYLI